MTLQEGTLVGGPVDLDVLSLDMALVKLARDHERAARVVELKYFGGMTFEEIADETGISLATAKRDWQFARAWLLTELRESDADDADQDQ